MSRTRTPREWIEDEADPRHGTTNGYINCGCRCERCRAAHAYACKIRRAERRARLAKGDPTPVHGTSSTYTNWHCRCKPCTVAHSAAAAAAR